MQNNICHKNHLRGSSSLQETEKRLDESAIPPALQQRNQPNEIPTDASVVDLGARSGRGGLVGVLDSARAQ